MKKLVLDEVYYRVTYPSVGLLYPQIESFIYIGKNLTEDDTSEDYYYFQPSQNYAKYGSAISSSEYIPAVVRLSIEELDYDMFDTTELLREINDAADRREKRRRS